MALITSSDFVARQPGKAHYVARQRLYVNRDRTRVVPEDSPEAAFLLCSPGKPLDTETVKRLGLLDQPAAVTEPEPEPESDTKMVEGPPADKAVRTRTTKRAPVNEDDPLARHPLPGPDAFAPDDDEDTP